MGKKKRTYNSNREDVDAKTLFILIAIVSIVSFFRKIKEGNPWAIALLIAIVLIIGVLLFFIIRKKIKKNQYKNNIDLQQIDKMSGVEFEEYLMRLFEKLGYRVTLTKRSNDYGADLIMKKDEKTIIVQAKRYHQKVGIAAVQEVYAAKRVYKADEAWIVTTNEGFTKQAIHLAKLNDVLLIGRNVLVKFIMLSADSR